MDVATLRSAAALDKSPTENTTQNQQSCKMRSFVARPSMAVACAGSASDPKFVTHPAFTRALAALHRHILPGEEADDEASLQESSIPRGGTALPTELAPTCSHEHHLQD